MKLLKRGPSGIKSDAMSKSWFGTGGVPRQSCIFGSMMDRGSWLRNLAAADADEGHSRPPRQDTGGSDALCLGAPPVPEGPDYLEMTIQADPG